MENSESSENKIKLLKEVNKRLYDDLYYLETIVKKKKEIIERNYKEIHSLCNHDYEREVEYGERTRYCCRKCNHWY